MNPKDAPEPQVSLLGPVVAFTGVVVTAWLIPVVVVVVHAHRWPSVGLVDAVAGTLRVLGEQRWSDPASAFPQELRTLMPDAATWWAIVAGVLLAAVAGFGGAWRRLEPLAARERLGRRPYEFRGSAPRSWGRRRDLGRRRPRGGFAIGRLDGRRIRTDEEAHIAVVAPTRAGKTTRCIIPWLLEHRGPAIVTSTKRDVLEATARWRGHIGRVSVYDPFGSDSVHWTPLDGCDSWSHALRQAQWLADATQGGGSDVAAYWRGEAAKLLAPLLHAAALGRLGMPEVISWLDRQDSVAPTKVLMSRDAAAAAHQLGAVLGLDPRNRGTTYMSAGSVLNAYRFPEVLASAKSELTPELFLDGGPHTLYIVAGERHQRLLAPLIVCLLSSLIHSAIEGAAFADRRSPRLRVLIDEAANVAPIHDLPRVLSQAAGHGIRIATVWQSLAQLRDRYRQSADTVLANSTAKLFMGPIADHSTRSYVLDLLGDEPAGRENGRRRPKGTAAALQQLQRDRALLITADALPAMIALRPWWADRHSRSRGG